MAKSKARGLGRGLESLFSDTELIANTVKTTKETPLAKTVEAEDDRKAGDVIYIDVNNIKPNAHQPRKTFDEEKIQELTDSIETHGLIQPILVRSAGNGYELVAGERRWRAARRAGLKRIPAIVRELDEQQNMFIAVIENMQREDLNAIEEAAALEEMIRKFGLTQEEISKTVGKSRPYITNALRLLKLPESIQTMVSEGTLSGGHARAVAGIKNEEEQIETARLAAAGGWSVRELENYINGASKGKGKKKKAAPRAKRRDVQDVEMRLKDALGTKVSIQYGNKKGKIEIEYYSRDELERLIELLLGASEK